jgi:WD40 repeat protein
MPYPDLYNDVQVIAQLFQKNLLSLSDDFPPMISSTIRDCWEWDPQGRPSAATIITQYPSLPPNALDLASSRPSLSYPSALHQNKLAVEVSPQAPERNSEVHMGWELPEPPKAYIAEDGKNNEDRSHSLGLDFNEKLFTSMPGIITSVTVDYDNHFDSTSVWHYRRPITSVSGGSAVAFGSSNGYVRVWILEPDSLTCKTFRASQDSAADLALPSARHIVACGNFDDPDTRVWDLQACAMLTHPEGLLLRVQNVALSDHGLYLVKVGYALSGSTVIQLWRTTYPTMLGTVHVPNVDVLKPMALSSDGIVVFSKAGSLHAFSMLHVPTQLICHTPVLSWQIDAIAFCGKFAIRIIHFDGWTNRVRCATVDMNSDVSTDVELVNPGRDSWRDPKISCTTLSKDGNRVAVGFRGGHIQTYHAADGRPVNKLLEHHDRTHRQAITGTAFTADSEFLFATNAVGWCWLWHVLSARPVLALTPEGGVEIHDENALAVFREAIAK